MMRLSSVSHHRGKLVLHSNRLVGEQDLLFIAFPQEVRNVVVKKGAPEDGTTTPMRTLPGGALPMYPETDVPTISIDSGHWRRISENVYRCGR